MRARAHFSEPRRHSPQLEAWPGAPRRIRGAGQCAPAARSPGAGGMGGRGKGTLGSEVAEQRPAGEGGAWKGPPGRAFRLSLV